MAKKKIHTKNTSQPSSAEVINLNTPRETEDVFSKRRKKKIDVAEGNALSRHAVFVKLSQFLKDRSREVSQFAMILLVLMVIMSSLYLTREAFRVKGEVSAEFSSAYSYILDAEADVRAMNFDSARSKVDEATSHVLQMEESLQVLGFLRGSLLAMDGSTGSLQDLLLSSHHIGSGFSQLLEMLENMHRFQRLFATTSLDEFKTYYPSITEFLGVQFAHMHVARESFQDGHVLLSTVDLSLLPTHLKDRVAELDARVTQGITLLDTVLELEPVIFDILGERYPRRYVILLQNATEMRPTGGFLGSMIFVTLNDGWLTEVTFVDVYDIAGQIVSSVLAPPGLEQLTNRFGLQDANYFPDFVESATNILWFLDQGKVETVDGVIAINTTLVAQLLRSMEGIILDTPGGTMEVTSENFEEVLSLLVEGKVYGASPKVILESFIDQVKQRLSLLTLEDVLRVVDYAYQHRSVAIYARSEVVQNFIEEQGLDGRMPVPTTDQDFLMVVPTSISANKSDQYIDQRIKHETEFLDGGIALNRLTIRRSHTWSPATEEHIQNLADQMDIDLDGELLRIMGDGANRQYLRIYVPRGSMLMNREEDDNVQVTEEGDFTIFSVTMDVAPGDTVEEVLVYKLPFAYDSMDRYELLVAKSVGDYDSYFQKSFLNFNHVVTSAFSERGERSGEGALVFADMLEHSLEYFAILQF